MVTTHHAPICSMFGVRKLEVVTQGATAPSEICGPPVPPPKKKVQDKAPLTKIMCII